MMQNKFNEIIEKLKCIDCGKGLNSHQKKLKCHSCGRIYDTSKKYLTMIPLKGRLPQPHIYKDKEYLNFMQIYDEVLDYHYKRKGIIRSINDRYHDKIKKIVSAAFKKSSETVLDVGCGNGHHWKGVLPEKSVIGLDINIKALESMESEFPQIPLIQADCTEIPLQDESIDTVFALSVLEHLYYLDEALMEFRRVLNRSGTVVISIPTEGGVLWNTGRKLTTDRYFKKKYGIDHSHVIKITHCNTAKKIIERVKKYFNVKFERYDPFFVHDPNINLFYHALLEKK